MNVGDHGVFQHIEAHCFADKVFEELPCHTDGGAEEYCESQFSEEVFIDVVFSEENFRQHKARGKEQDTGNGVQQAVEPRQDHVDVIGRTQQTAASAEYYQYGQDVTHAEAYQVFEYEHCRDKDHIYDSQQRVARAQFDCGIYHTAHAKRHI